MMRRLALFGLLLLLGGACLGLGFWQLRRLSARRLANREALAGRALPLLVGGDGGGGGGGGGAALLQANRRARLTGSLDEGREFLLRGRVIQGVPAVVVVTPLRLAGRDTAVLVNRGYLPAPDAVTPGAAVWSEPGRQAFTGVLLPVPDQGDGAPLEHGGHETWQRLELGALRARLPYPLAPLYLVAEPDSAEGDRHTVRGKQYPFRAEPPPLSEGPHLMYAVQWFGIAAAMVAFGILFVLRRGPRKSADD